MGKYRKLTAILYAGKILKQIQNDSFTDSSAAGAGVAQQLIPAITPSE